MSRPNNDLESTHAKEDIVPFVAWLREPVEHDLSEVVHRLEKILRNAY